MESLQGTVIQYSISIIRNGGSYANFNICSIFLIDIIFGNKVLDDSENDINTTTLIYNLFYGGFGNKSNK